MTFLKVEGVPDGPAAEGVPNSPAVVEGEGIPEGCGLEKTPIGLEEDIMAVAEEKITDMEGLIKDVSNEVVAGPVLAELSVNW